MQKLKPSDRLFLIIICLFALANLVFLTFWLKGKGIGIPLPLLEQARLALDKGDFARTERILQAALEKNPENPQVLSALGEYYMVKGHLKGAIFCWEEALKQDPEKRDYAVKLILPYFLTGQAETGILQLEKFIKQNPEDPINYFDCANLEVEIAASRRMEKLAWKPWLKKAQDFYRQGLSLSPDHRAPDFLAGKMELLNGRPQKAVPLFESALKSPQTKDLALKIDLHAALAILYLENHQPAPAKENFEAAFNTLDSWKEIHYQRTLHNRELFALTLEAWFGEPLSSAQLQQFALEYNRLIQSQVYPQLKEDNIRAKFYALESARESGNYPQALSIARDLLENFGKPRQPQCFFHNFFFQPLYQAVLATICGEMAEKTGAYGKAAEYYRRALQALPGNPIVEERLKTARRKLK